MDHASIVKVLDAFQEHDHCWIVMEYVGGGTRVDLLRREGQLPVIQVVDIGLRLADALAHTHSHELRIVHRDLKPSNALLREDGYPLLSDFGLVHVEESSITESNAIVGTFDYLSPQALNNQKIGRRSDIWALGVMLFEMLAGQQPFRKNDKRATFIAILTQKLPDLEVLGPDAPKVLVDFIYRMLEKEPSACSARL